MCQAFIHGHAMEAMRFRKHDPADDCEGALIWSYSEPWGEIGWSLLDYYLRRKPSYYWSAARVSRSKSSCGSAAINWSRGWSTTRCSRSKALWNTAGGGSTAHAAGAIATGRRSGGRNGGGCRRKNRFRRRSAIRGSGSTRPCFAEKTAWRWTRSSGARTVSKAGRRTPQIKVTPTADGCLEVSSPVFVHAVHTEDHGHELISDNWFDLLPGVPVRVRLAPGNTAESIHFEAVMAK